ncbi:MAG: c-type cytochrome [Luteitalea sp.]|nr:c-type cytochrome [Luteitalea sp.]
MKKEGCIRLVAASLFFTGLFAFTLGTGLSAQYAGWTIPEGGKDEKSPIASPPAVSAKGKALFGTNCQKCHGPAGQGDGPDSNGAAADLTDEFRIELNPEGVLHHKVWNGHPPEMPAFKSTLTKEEVWTLVEYLKALRQP